MKKYLYYFISLWVSVFLMQSAHAQTNAPSGATQVPAPTLTPVAAPSGYSGITNFNQVRVWTPQQPYQDMFQVISSDRKPEEVLQTTSYFDGMGRPLQTVAKQIGSAAYGKQDAVTPIVYDALGRVAQQYLPYMSATSDGNIKTNPFSDQQTFYSSTYVTDQPALTGEKFFYSQLQYEASPLSRVQASFAPGNSWAGSNRGTSQQYSLNTNTDSVLIWKLHDDEVIGDDKNLPYTAGRYDEATLYKNSTTDEHGKKKISYTDKEGKTILAKIQRDNSPTSGHSGWICTYYIYDDLGILRCIIQPQAVQYMNTHTWDLTATLLTEQCFRYEYDGRKRCIAKKIPGAAWLYMVYDTRDRLVFSQDGNQRKNNRWNTTVYDNQNRITATGITTYTGSWQNLIDYVNSLSDNSSNINITGTGPSTIPTNLVVNERQNGRTAYQASNEVTIAGEFTTEDNAAVTIEIVSPAPSSFTNSIAVFNNPVPSVGTFIPLTTLYYDDYSFTTNTYDNSNNSKLDAGSNPYADPLPSTPSNNTYGKATGTKIRVIEDATDLTKGSWLSAVYYYDDKSRVIQTQQENYKGGKDISTARYDFVGKTVCTYDVHNNPSGEINNLRIKTNKNYDHVRRLLSITKQLNDEENTKRTLAEYSYDHLGKLKSKSIGQKRGDDGTLTTNPLDNIDYTYNIRGWLQGINASFSKSSTDNSRYFGEQLNYDWGMQHSQYNGSIAGAQWKTKGGGIQRSYGYGYDNTNQLLFADYNQYYNSSWNKNGASGSVDFSTRMGNSTDANTAYDYNGNIQAMKQWGLKLGGSQVIDNMQYSYNSSGLSNKLDAVTEDAGIGNTDNKLGDFTDNNTTGSDYSYDDNGNLLVDKNKNISSISYNYLDLPTTITVKDKGTISYIYDALGNKLEKRVHQNPNTENGNQEKNTITTYIGNTIYVDNSLKQIFHEGGRVRFIENGTKIVYDYFESDHQGNTRVILTDEYQKDQYPAATMEEANAAVENIFYSNIETTRAPRPSGFNDATTSPNDYVAKLRGDANKIGPGMMLKVMAGDKISIQVNSWYDAGGSPPAGNNSIVGDLISTLSNVIPASSGGKISTGNINATVLQNPIAAFSDLVNNSTNTITIKPNAHLCWVMLSEAELSYIAEGSGCKQVGEDKTLTPLNSTIDVPRNGYLYVYVSNETKNIDVYFDNLQVNHLRGPLLEENSYYAFGGDMYGICSKAIKGLAYINNNYKFNSGSELNEDLGLNVYETPYRNYNHQIGRFQGIDQLAELSPGVTPMQFGFNNPTLFNDPTGLGPDDVLQLAEDRVAAVDPLEEVIVSNTSKNQFGNIPSDQILFRGGYGYGSNYGGYSSGGYGGGRGSHINKLYRQPNISFDDVLNNRANIIDYLNQTEIYFNAIDWINDNLNPLVKGTEMITGYSYESGFTEEKPRATTMVESMMMVMPALKTESLFLGTAEKALLKNETVNIAKGGLSESRALGIAGEEAVGVGAKTRITSLTGTANYRIPDILTKSTIEEIKNVQHLNLTRQLNDFYLHSQKYDLEFILHTRPTTTFSGPLQNLINNGSIIVKPIPFK